MKSSTLAIFASAALTLSTNAFATGGGDGGSNTAKCEPYVQVNTQNPYITHSGQNVWTVWQWGNKGQAECRKVTMWCNIYNPKGAKANLDFAGIHTWGGFQYGDVSGSGNYRWLGKKYPVNLAPGQNWNYALVMNATGRPGDWAQVDCHMYVRGKRVDADWQKIMIAPC